MNKRIVLWGNDANDEKILVAIELIDAENKVKIHTFDEKAATQEVYKTMMDTWRTNEGTTLPEGADTQERPLSITDDLLPEEIKVERTDIIARAKAEWHFIVLSSKLYQMYDSELEDFKDKVDNMSEYSEQTWEEMKAFWNKVQEQAREKNLFREHAGQLREKTNSLFDKLKELKKTFQDGFRKESAEKAAKFKEELNEIEEKIEKGLGLKPIFDQLKSIQNKFKEERFTKEDQRKLWNNIDAAFKKVKEKRFGEKAQATNGALERVQRRFNGLLNAINKMEKSIQRDKSDLEWEQKRIDRTDGQLEMQIRQAKIIMIQERVNSKSEKLDDMLKTKVDLEKKIEKEKAREAKRADEKKAEEVAQQVKEKIATEIKEKKEALSDEADKLKELAKEIKKPAKKKAAVNELLQSKAPDTPATETKKEEVVEEESLIAEASSQIGAALGNVVDTVRAVAEVVEGRLDKKVADIKASVTKFKEEQADEVIEDMKTQSSSLVDEAMEAVNEVADKVEDRMEAVKGDIEKFNKEEVGPAVAETKASLNNAVKEAMDAVKAIKTKVEGKVDSAVGEAKETVTTLKEDKADDIVDEIKDNVGEFLTGALSAFRSVSDKIEGRLEHLANELKQDEEE